MKLLGSLHILLLAVAMLFAVQPALACDCTVPSIAASYKKSSAIFRGKVSYISYRSASPTEVGRPAIVMFEVKNVWQGVTKGRKFSLHTMISDESCQGMDFKQGEEYLVFADKDYSPGKSSPWTFTENKDYTYKTSRCLGTTKFAYSEVAVKQLDHLAKLREEKKAEDVVAVKKEKEPQKVVLKEEVTPVKTILEVKTEELEQLLTEATEYGKFAAKGAQVAGYLAISSGKDKAKVLQEQLAGVAIGTKDDQAIRLAFEIGVKEAENDNQANAFDNK